MIALLALLIHAPVNVDLTAALGGRPLNGAPTVFVDNEATWIFSFNEWPSFYRHDVASRMNAYESEHITVGTYVGPQIGVHTVSQGAPKRQMAKVLVGHGRTVMPVLAPTKNSLVVLSSSGGVVPIDPKTKLPRRAFAVSVVHLDGRGEGANEDYALPRDDYGWYLPVAARADGDEIDLLVAHTLSTTAETRLEAYRISGGKLSRASTGIYKKLDGKTYRVWDSVQLSRPGSGPAGPAIAADAATGSVAFIRNDGVIVSGSHVLPSVEWVRFIDGVLYAGTRRNPDMKTLAETYVWNTVARRFDLLGGFQVAGVSPNGKYWVVHFPHNGRYSLTPVPRHVP